MIILSNFNRIYYAKLKYFVIWDSLATKKKLLNFVE